MKVVFNLLLVDLQPALMTNQLQFSGAIEKQLQILAVGPAVTV